MEIVIVWKQLKKNFNNFNTEQSSLQSLPLESYQPAWIMKALQVVIVNSCRDRIKLTTLLCDSAETHGRI